jgi:excisionase family DNA binding protein
MFEDRISAMNAETTVPPSPSDFEKRVYTVDEIQDILQISKTTAYNLVNSGVFHSVRIGGQHRISKRSFDAWLDHQDTVPPESQVCD